MKNILVPFRSYIRHLGLISFVIDMLMLTPSLFMLSVLDKVITSRSNETLFVLFMLAVYGVLLMALLDNLRTRLFVRFGATFTAELAPRVLSINLRGNQQSDLARHALEDLDILGRFLAGSGIKSLFAIPWIPILVGVLYLFHWALAATALGLLAVLSVLAYLDHRLTSGKQKEARKVARRSVALASFARQNAEAVGSLGMQEAIIGRWSEFHNESSRLEGETARTSALVQGAAKFVRVTGQMLGLVVGAWLFLNSQGVSTGVMVAALLIMGRTLAPIDQAIAGWKSFVDARSAYGRLSALFSEAAAGQVPVMELPRPQGHLFVERMSLQVGPGQFLLKGIHFKLSAGESLGIIGPSGSGKTTLARLVVGLIKPTYGQARIDGSDVFQWAQTDLGQYVGYLPQQVVLFPGTVAENIARMKDSESNADSIIAAAKKARVHAMIQKLPQGYSTEVGEGGSRLSGGQRQLIGLARALFGNPSLVVLDEPNASLDGPAELALAEVIRSLKVSRVTLIVVAHKPSMIRDMDRLLVLRDGEQESFGEAEQVLRKMNTLRELEGPATKAMLQSKSS